MVAFVDRGIPRFFHGLIFRDAERTACIKKPLQPGLLGDSLGIRADPTAPELSAAARAVRVETDAVFDVKLGIRQNQAKQRNENAGAIRAAHPSNEMKRRLRLADETLPGLSFATDSEPPQDGLVRQIAHAAERQMVD